MYLIFIYIYKIIHEETEIKREEMEIRCEATKIMREEMEIMIFGSITIYLLYYILNK
jgi:hypothetical protein